MTVKQYSNPEPAEHRVARGITFRVRKNKNQTTTRQWRFRYSFGGRQSELTHLASGVFKENLASDWRVIQGWQRQLSEGTDPKAVQRAAELDQVRRGKTFECVAKEYLPIYQSTLRNPKQKKAIWSELKRHAFPIIGSTPIGEVKTRDVANVLRPLWHNHYAVAKKVRDRISRTCQYAVAMEYRDNNPVDMVIIRQILGDTTYKTKHFAAPAESYAPNLFKSLFESDDHYDWATALLMLTWSRIKPLREMKVSEVSGDLWDCPKTKNGNPYRIPLSSPALQILNRCDLTVPDAFVFPGKRGECMNENVFCNCIKRHSPNVRDTAHGIRATLSTYINAHHDFGEEIIEVCMQHQVKTMVQRAYNRGDWFEKRRPVMDAIALWLTNE